jgi:hypothetical protein
MVLLNFAHPLTESQKAQVEQLTDHPVERILEGKVQFDPARPFAEQVRALLDGAGLSAAEWQGLPLLVNPPSLSAAACLVLAELHGRAGYFPAIIRLRPLPDTTPPAFEVAEVLNLQAVRDRARAHR